MSSKTKHISSDTPKRPVPFDVNRGKLALQDTRSGDKTNRAAVALLTDLAESFSLQVLNSSLDCIKLIELDGSLSFMNHNGMKSMQIDSFDMVASRQWTDLWPKESEGLLKESLEHALGGQTSRFEAFCPTAKGEERWWEVTVAPVTGKGGNVERLVSTSRDITERVTRERTLADRDRQLKNYARQLNKDLKATRNELEESKTLVGEIDHRVKNSFALIVGMLRLQSRAVNSDEAREAIEDAANRVNTLSRVHEQLHSNDPRAVELRPYVTSLVKDLSSALQQSDDKVALHVDDLIVASDTAISVGLILAELFGNSVKHTGTEELEISISLCRNQREDLKTLTLSVQDNGEGVGDDFQIDKTKGLGMRICRIYSQRLGGELEWEHAEDGGVRFFLDFPG